MIDFVRFVIVGFVAGWIAAITVRGRILPRGCLSYTLLGMAGALVGGYVFRALGGPAVGRVITATVGAILVLVVMRGLRRG